MQKRWFMFSFLTLILVVLAVGCAPAAPEEKEKVRLRWDWFPFGYHAPIVLGKEKGFYSDVGIDLEFTGGGGEVRANTHVSEGRAEFAAITSPEGTLLSAQAGEKVKFVAQLFPKSVSGLMCRKDANIKTPKDLEGKTLSTTGTMTVDRMLPVLLKRNNVDESKIKWLTVSPAIKNTIVLEGKAVCVGVPIWTRGIMEKFGGSTQVLYADFGMNMPSWGLLASTDFIAKKPQVVTNFIAATIKSWDYARTRQTEAIEAMAKLYPDDLKDKEMHAAVLKYAYELYDMPARGWRRGEMKEKDWKDLYDVLKETGDVTKEFPITNVFTNDFLPK